MQTIKEKVRKIRSDFLNERIDKKELEELYQTYNPLSNIKKFIETGSKQFPLFNCGIASCYLQKKLGRGYIVQGKYHNPPHTFVMIQQTVIDITADQYEGPSVYIGPLKEPWKLNETCQTQR